MKINAHKKFQILSWLVKQLNKEDLIDQAGMFVSEAEHMIQHFEENNNLKEYGCETCILEDYPAMYCKLLAKVGHVAIN